MSGDGWDDVVPDEWDDEDEKKKEEENKKTQKGHFAAWEDQVIRDDWQTHTDEEIGDRLGRTAEAIARRRKIMGLKKKNGRPKKSTRKKAIFENPDQNNLSKLSKEDRVEFYKTQFEKSHRYPWLERTLLEDELEYYKIKYIETLDMMDTLTLQEEDIVHSMIMKEIQIIRLQTQIKEQLEDFLNSDEEEGRRGPAQYLYQDLDKAEQQYVKYQEKLRITRKQRLETNGEQKITIAQIVADLQDYEVKRRAGELAGQISAFAEECKKEMHKNKFLLGD